MIITPKMESPSPILHASTAIQHLSSVTKNSAAVGSAWMLSSMVFTTYYSTAFLKYGNDVKSRQFIIEMKRDNKANHGPLCAISSNLRNVLKMHYSRPQLLTIFRLSGSFLLGIFGHPNFFLWKDRLQQSFQSMRAFMLPAIFMFIANYCNVIALDRLGISLTYTSKCGIPILTG